MTRLEANREILRLLSIAVEQNPDWRFGQTMRNCGAIRENDRATFWVDEFYAEGEDILKRMQLYCKNL